MFKHNRQASMTHTTRIEFDASLPGYAEDVCIAFDRLTEWSHGLENTDADGNRGQWMTSIDVDDYANVTVDGTPCITKDAMQAVESYMQANEPEMPEAPEPDPDEPDDYEPYDD